MSSKSPQSRRGSAQSHEQFSKGKLAQGMKTSPEPENSAAREIAGTEPTRPDTSKDTMNANATAIMKENQS
jgi:hypothetical protein